MSSSKKANTERERERERGERERERERERGGRERYIYIYIERERETETQRVPWTGSKILTEPLISGRKESDPSRDPRAEGLIDLALMNRWVLHVFIVTWPGIAGRGAGPKWSKIDSRVLLRSWS